MTFVLPEEPLPEEPADQEDAARSPDTDVAMSDRTLARVHAEFHQGPLPSPEALRTYEDVLPGAAERIFALVERNLDLAERQLHVEERRQDQIHRETMTHVTANHRAEQQGQWMAFILACVILGVSFGLIATGAPVATIVGVAGMISALSGLVGGFVSTSLRNRWRRSDRAWDDASRLPEPPEPDD